MNKSKELYEEREFCRRLLAHDIHTQREKDAALTLCAASLIEKTTSVEQAHEIAGVVLNAHNTKKEKAAAIRCLIDRATSAEQLREIGAAIVKAVLVSNPDVYYQLPNGNWILREQLQ